MAKRNAKHPRKQLLDTRTPDTKACIFCSRRETTHEHIFSRWTHKHMLARGKGKASSMSAIALPDRTEYVQTKMSGEMRDWQIKCVCGGDNASCNNGWMRRLDEAADPIMTPLILGQEIRLSEADQRVVAAWAVLKAIVADHHRVHHTQRKQFRRTRRPPAGWTVWMGHFERTSLKFEWVSRPFPVLREAVLARRKSKVTFAANANATTQIIKHLFIHVAHTPNPAFGRRWQFLDGGGNALSGSLVRIWPTSGVSIKWPLAALSDRDAAIAANSIWEAVQQRARQERGFPTIPA